MTLLDYVMAAIILVALELVYFKMADKLNIIDKPNARSSHKSLVIRGGGIIFLFGAWIWSCFNGFQYPWFLTGITLIAGISFVDDIKPQADSLRLIIQTIAMGLVFHEWGLLEWSNWWIILLAFILCVGIINAYNFMDGINGITGGYSLAVLFPLLFLNRQLNFIDYDYIEVIIIAVIIFCFFNFRKHAKCFAGDVGSVAIAFFIIFALGKLIIQSGDFTYIVFLSVYGVDTVLTIVHRIMLHENLGQAHRKHCYQILANELHVSHVNTSLFYTFLQLFISIGLIIISDNSVGRWIYLATTIIALSTAYILFMRNYYHLHEEYLKKLAKE